MLERIGRTGEILEGLNVASDSLVTEVWRLVKARVRDETEGGVLVGLREFEAYVEGSPERVELARAAWRFLVIQNLPELGLRNRETGARITRVTSLTPDIQPWVTTAGLLKAYIAPINRPGLRSPELRLLVKWVESL